MWGLPQGGWKLSEGEPIHSEAAADDSAGQLHRDEGEQLLEEEGGGRGRRPHQGRLLRRQAGGGQARHEAQVRKISMIYCERKFSFYLLLFARFFICQCKQWIFSYLVWIWGWQACLQEMQMLWNPLTDAAFLKALALKHFMGLSLLLFWSWGRAKHSRLVQA